MSDASAATSGQPEIILIGSYLVALVMDVDRLPLMGETLLARNFREVYGGKGSDMAVQAARLGARVRFVGCVGDDNFGRAFVHLMQQEGVDIGLLRQSQDLSTGVGFILKASSGHNIITIDTGANQLFDAADVDRAVPYMTPQSVTLIQLEIPLETALYAAWRGHEAGSTVILNPAPGHDLREVDLSAVDILTPNESEARVCLGLKPDDPTDNVGIAQRLLSRGCGTVVMTLGEKGSLIVTPDGATATPAFAIPNTVDSTGAGDSFNAALATSLIEGASLHDAVRFASAVAGLCCTRWETVPSYHTRAEVEAFLEKS